MKVIAANFNAHPTKRFHNRFYANRIIIHSALLLVPSTVFTIDRSRESELLIRTKAFWRFLRYSILWAIFLVCDVFLFLFYWRCFISYSVCAHNPINSPWIRIHFTKLVVSNPLKSFPCLPSIVSLHDSSNRLHEGSSSNLVGDESFLTNSVGLN